jgi:hypothetical protein
MAVASMETEPGRGDLGAQHVPEIDRRHAGEERRGDLGERFTIGLGDVFSRDSESRAACS